MVKKNRIGTSVRNKSFGGFLISLLFLLTFTLIFFNKTDNFLANSIKNIGIDVVGPITRLISSPITITKNIKFTLDHFKDLKNQNLKLREEVIRLKKWQTLAIKNSRENRVFKRLLNSTSHNVEIIKTASVVNQSPGMYTKLITINAGLNYNISRNLAAINEKGLVGKTVYSTNLNSKILLINDPLSSIPVKTLSDNSYAILSGSSNGKFLISSFIQGSKMPRIGDLLVTSGNAKIFPRDILVAKVIKINQDSFIALPYVDFKNLNYVQIVKSK